MSKCRDCITPSGFVIFNVMLHASYIYSDSSFLRGSISRIHYFAVLLNMHMDIISCINRKNQGKPRYVITPNSPLKSIEILITNNIS